MTAKKQCITENCDFIAQIGNLCGRCKSLIKKLETDDRPLCTYCERGRLISGGERNGKQRKKCNTCGKYQ